MAKPKTKGLEREMQKILDKIKEQSREKKKKMGKRKDILEHF